MEFFVYCRDRPDTEQLRSTLIEAHWSFMDRYADGMIARGPTLTEDGSAATGSLHIVDLPDRAAADEFAFDEPNFRAGVYDEVLIRRWRSELDRAVADFDRDPGRNRRFLILGQGAPDRLASQVTGERSAIGADRTDRLIVSGSLWSDDGAGWLGTASIVEMSDRAAVHALIAADPGARAGWYASVEVHPWEVGGRR
ncbi:MAG TPA: YciI family protein [Actinomycetes bacterium]|nr:YciI family protein [Actinomycetes bacterium]